VFEARGVGNFGTLCILYPLSIRKQHNSIALNIAEKRPSSPVIHISYDHSVKYYVQCAGKSLKLLLQMSDFKVKMHQVQFRLGLRPRPRWGTLQRSLRPLTWIYGVSYLMSVLSSFVVKLLNIRGVVPLRHLRHVPPRQYCLMLHFLKSS